MSDRSWVGSSAKATARRLVGAVSPALLRRIQLGRARKRYLQEPTAGPRRVLLEPTTGCNHRCIMCWDHSTRLARPTPGRHMAFDAISALLHDLADMGAEEIWLAGRGEPLVHPRAREILKLIGDLGMRSIITTNAGLLTEEFADQLCQWNLQQLSVSIDSGTPETYHRVHGGAPEDRARILGIIKRLSTKRPKPRLLVSMVLSQWNFRELLGLVQDAIDSGATGVVVGGMRPVPFDSTDLALSEDEWSRVRADLETARSLVQAAGVDLAADNIRPAELPRAETWPYAEMGCFIGHLFSVVDVDGAVHGCCTCQNRLGSLAEGSFAQIWRAHPYRIYRRILREMPSTGITPPRCECRHGCGHIPENAQLQQELGFTFPEQLPPSEFATRLDVAAALCRHLDKALPSRERDYDFADLSAPDAREVASRLRGRGIMSGTGSMDGISLFEPARLVAREEFEGILRRALEASSPGGRWMDALVARPDDGHPSEPITKTDVEGWLAGVARALARGCAVGGLNP